MRDIQYYGFWPHHAQTPATNPSSYHSLPWPTQVSVWSISWKLGLRKHKLGVLKINRCHGLGLLPFKVDLVRVRRPSESCGFECKSLRTWLAVHGPSDLVLRLLQVRRASKQVKFRILNLSLVLSRHDNTPSKGKGVQAVDLVGLIWFFKCSCAACCVCAGTSSA